MMTSPVLLTAQLAIAPTFATGAGFQDGSGPQEGEEVPVTGPASALKSPMRRADNIFVFMVSETVYETNRGATHRRDWPW